MRKSKRETTDSKSKIIRKKRKIKREEKRNITYRKEKQEADCAELELKVECSSRQGG